MFDKEKARWHADGMLVCYGAKLGDRTGWRNGATNTGDEVRADSIVEAHNEIVDSLCEEYGKLGVHLLELTARLAFVIGTDTPDTERKARAVLVQANLELKEAAKAAAGPAYDELWGIYSAFKPEVQPIYKALQRLIDLTEDMPDIPSASAAASGNQGRLPGL